MTQQNRNLTNAKRAKNDEFYTQLSDIENELKHYKPQFKDKIVFCNCDDPYESNFFKYFTLNFKHLGLKKLITTSYSDKQPMFKVEINGVEDLNGDGAVNLVDVEELVRAGNVKTQLRQNGDFRSDECIELLKEADIVVTNPPFSLFREYINQLVEYEKKFLVIGNMNAITYKEIFKLIKENRLWMGYGFNKSLEFRLPEEYEKYNNIKDGQKYGVVPAICWYTNLDVKKRHEKIELYKQYTPEEFPKYDNYDAIEVSKVCNIPKDYEHTMGVPISFLGKFNPEQFEIIGLGISKSGLEIGVQPYKPEHRKYRKEIQKRGTVDGDLYMMTGGIVIVPYARILIRRR